MDRERSYGMKHMALGLGLMLAAACIGFLVSAVDGDGEFYLGAVVIALSGLFEAGRGLLMFSRLEL